MQPMITPLQSVLPWDMGSQEGEQPCWQGRQKCEDHTTVSMALTAHLSRARRMFVQGSYWAVYKQVACFGTSSSQCWSLQLTQPGKGLISGKKHKGNCKDVLILGCTKAGVGDKTCCATWAARMGLCKLCNGQRSVVLFVVLLLSYAPLGQGAKAHTPSEYQKRSLLTARTVP